MICKHFAKYWDSPITYIRRFQRHISSKIEAYIYIINDTNTTVRVTRDTSQTFKAEVPVPMVALSVVVHNIEIVPEEKNSNQVRP